MCQPLKKTCSSVRACFPLEAIDNEPTISHVPRTEVLQLQSGLGTCGRKTKSMNALNSHRDNRIDTQTPQAIALYNDR